VRRRWTYRQKRVGRPPIDPALAALICRMGLDTSRWGSMWIKEECRKLGMRVAATTVKKALRAAGLEPAPRRDGPSWSEFLRAQADGILACDVFTVETVCLRTLSVLFFIEVGSRRLHMTSSTRNPSGEFVAQQARSLSMDGELEEVTFLSRDRDSKSTRAFDEASSPSARVIKTPVRAPREMRLLSGSFAPFDTRAWISRSCSADDTWTGSFGATRSTTTPSAPTEVWIFKLQPERPSGRSHPTRHAFAGSMSSVA
jgi:putative transposase